LKHIKYVMSIITAICIVVIILPGQRCKAALLPSDFPIINRMIDDKLYQIYGQENIGHGNMSTGAYNYGQYLDGEISKLWGEVNALKGNVGASAQDVNEVKGKVDETNNKIDSVQQSVDSIDVQKDLDEFGKNITANSDGTVAGDIISLTDLMIGSCNSMWTLVGDVIHGYGVPAKGGYASFFQVVNPEKYATGDIIEVLRAFAYSIVLLFFSINLVEITVKYEMLSLKSVIIIAARIFIAKTLIDKSGTICVYIIKSMSTLATDILKVGNDNLLMNFPSTGNIFYKNETPVIGPLIDIVMAILISSIVGFLLTIILIVAAIILIKLVLRAFELTLLIVVSPVYIACWSSEVTKQYCRNFLISFIQVAAQIVYMSIVYSVAAKVISLNGHNVGNWGDFTSWIASMFPQIVLLIGMAIMMIKPPKVLTGLIH